MVTVEDAENKPEEYMGRDIKINNEVDLAISSNNDLATVRYEENLKQAIINRLRTSLGELELHPDYGSRLNELVGTIPNDLTLSIAQLHVKEALLQEPRIDEIVSIKPSFREGSNNQIIDIDIVVKPIKVNDKLNLIYSLFV